MTPKARSRTKAALDLGSRVQRQEQRGHLGSLASLRVKPGTRKRYTLAYGRFCEFVLCLGLVLNSFECLDSACAAYIEELWQRGDPKHWCNDILAALHHYAPGAKRRLPLSWALHRAWGKHEMPARACPIGVDLLLGLCGAWAHAGATRIALVIFAAYHLLLRTGEILGLRVGNLHAGKDGVRVVGLGRPCSSFWDVDWHLGTAYCRFHRARGAARSRCYSWR